jgi:uncharacterized protein YbaR (Trm112 family)
MIDAEFLRLLVCPSSRQPLRVADAAELARANASIGKGELKNRGGAVVTGVWTEALATADGAWLYPVQDGIPILLAAEAVPTAR